MAGVRYATVEHFFQAAKAHLAGDAATAVKILAAASPGKAKYWGRHVKGLDRSAWNAVRVDTMLKGVRAKFQQNSTLRNALLATGHAPLIESSPTDDFWGEGREGNGRNELGRLLTQVKSEL